MNAASFFSLETPAGSTPPAETSTSAAPEVLTTGNLEVFATLVDEALVRTAPALVDLPVLELAVPSAELIRPAIVLDPNLILLPPAATEDSSEIEEHSSSPVDAPPKPEPPKAESLPGLDILLLSQSFFVAPTLPVNWVVPMERPSGSSAKSGDEPVPVVESTTGGAERSASEAGEGAQVLFEHMPSVRTDAQELAAPLAATAPLPRSDVSPAPASESARLSPAPTKKAQAEQVEAPKLISGTAHPVHVENVGRLNLVEMGFKPAVDEPLPAPAKSSGASMPEVSPGTVAAAMLPERDSPPTLRRAARRRRYLCRLKR
jgi:hypothetical protein